MAVRWFSSLSQQTLWTFKIQKRTRQNWFFFKFINTCDQRWIQQFTFNLAILLLSTHDIDICKGCFYTLLYATRWKNCLREDFSLLNWCAGLLLKIECRRCMFKMKIYWRFRGQKSIHTHRFELDKIHLHTPIQCWRWIGLGRLTDTVLGALSTWCLLEGKRGGRFHPHVYLWYPPF